MKIVFPAFMALSALITFSSQVEAGNLNPAGVGYWEGASYYSAVATYVQLWPGWPAAEIWEIPYTVTSDDMDEVDQITIVSTLGAYPQIQDVNWWYWDIDAEEWEDTCDTETWITYGEGRVFYMIEDEPDNWDYAPDVWVGGAGYTDSSVNKWFYIAIFD